MRYLGYMSQCQHHCVSQCQLSLNAQKSNKKTEIFLSFLEQTTTAVEMFFKNVASQCKQLTAQAFTSFDFGRLRLQQVASVSIWNSQKNEQRFLYRHTVTHWGRSETVSGTAVGALQQDPYCTKGFKRRISATSYKSSDYLPVTRC